MNGTLYHRGKTHDHPFILLLYKLIIFEIWSWRYAECFSCFSFSFGTWKNVAASKACRVLLFRVPCIAPCCTECVKFQSHNKLIVKQMLAVHRKLISVTTSWYLVVGSGLGSTVSFQHSASGFFMTLDLMHK